MMIKTINGLVLALSVLSASAMAYECKTSVIESTTNEAYFLDNKDGTVTDLRFGLQWSVCSFGQTYEASDGSCKGEPNRVTSWEAAMATQDEVNRDKLAGKDDWRLPNIKELQSIVERQCRQPAIKLSIFKGTANGVYWSNTPDDSVNVDLKGRIVDFSDGGEILRATTTSMFVRHVRKI